jgi:hypothetical protein
MLAPVMATFPTQLRNDSFVAAGQGARSWTSTFSYWPKASWSGP